MFGLRAIDIRLNCPRLHSMARQFLLDKQVS